MCGKNIEGNAPAPAQIWRDVNKRTARWDPGCQLELLTHHPLLDGPPRDVAQSSTTFSWELFYFLPLRDGSRACFMRFDQAADLPAAGFITHEISR